MEIISRKQAKSLDLNYYFTGKQCKHGHISKRDISGSCYDCKIEFGRKNPRQRSEYMKGYLSKYQSENRPAANKRNREHYQRTREVQLLRSKDKRLQNKARYRELCAGRRARIASATPSWFEKDLVRKVYEMAEHYGLEVDHVVPITSDIVCGLHCWHNLQLLDRAENAKKLNRYWPDMPE